LSKLDGAELLKLPKQSPRITSTTMIDIQSEDTRSLEFKIKPHSLPVKSIQNLTKCDSELTNTTQQTDLDASAKNIIFENSRTRLGKKKPFIKTIRQDQNALRVSSPKKLKSPHEYQTGPSPVNPSTASTDLSIEGCCIQDDAHKIEVSDYSVDQNINNENHAKQNEADNDDKGADKEHMQSATTLSKKDSQPSTDKIKSSEMSTHGESNILLANQSEDNDKHTSISNSDDTRADKSITLTDESLLNFSLSDKIQILGMMEQTFPKSYSLEMSSSGKLNEPCSVLVSAQDASPEQVLDDNNNSNKETFYLNSYSSRADSANHRMCDLQKSNFPAKQ
jgi:hypothetical protein